MNPWETCILLDNLLESCWGIAPGRQGLISQDGAASKVSLGHGEERVIMFHLLSEWIAAVGLPTWRLRALTTPRPTVIFSGVRVSLASAPGKLSHTLCLALHRIPEEEIDSGQRQHCVCLPMPRFTQPRSPESLGSHLKVCVCLRVQGRLASNQVGVLSLAPDQANPWITGQ